MIVYDSFVWARTKGDAYYLLFLLRMRCLHCKFFAWWACGCSVGSLLMHGLTDEHHLHSYVLLFFCLDYLFASCLWWNCFCGCILFKRQKNIRCGCSILFCFFKNVFYMVNTSLACYMNIQKYVRSLLIDGLMDVHDLHSCVLLFFCLNYLLHCKSFCCDGHVAGHVRARSYMDRRMNIICILLFICSCVFIVCLHPAWNE